MGTFWCSDLGRPAPWRFPPLAGCDESGEVKNEFLLLNQKSNDLTNITSWPTLVKAEPHMRLNNLTMHALHRMLVSSESDHLALTMWERMPVGFSILGADLRFVWAIVVRPKR